MLNSTEIKRKIANKKNEMKDLYKEERIEEAYNVNLEILNLQKELDIAEAIENEEKNNFSNKTKVQNTDDVNPVRAYNKAVLGRNLTDKEREYVNNHFVENSTGIIGAEDERGGYLLPKEQITEIRELRRKRRSLKELVNVKKTTTRTGTYNVDADNQLELIAFDEENSIAEATLAFEQRKYEIKDYGLLIPVSNQFLQDTNIKITDEIGKEFAKGSVRTENKRIIAKFKELTPKKITDVDGLREIINVDLDSAISETARVITNQTSFNYLDSLKDENGIPLLEKSLSEPTKKMFKGKIIEVFDDKEITPVTPGSYIFFVGDPEEYLDFHEKEGIVVAISDEAGFKDNKTWLRAIERFDTTIVDKDALVLAELTPTTPAPAPKGE